jgi:hypothetical protein
VILLEFNYSRSKACSDAICRSLDFTEPVVIKQGKKTKIQIRLSKKRLAEALPFLKTLSRLKHVRVVVEGTDRAFNDVFGFLECHEARSKSEKPDEYCFGSYTDSANIFGCRATVDFGTIGKWNKSRRSWEFDKKKIVSTMGKATSSCSLCPAFKQKRIEKIVDALPDEVSPMTDPDWVVIQPMMVFPRMKVYRIKFYKTREPIWITGVLLTGINVLDRMSRKVGFTLPSYTLGRNIFSVDMRGID